MIRSLEGDAPQVHASAYVHPSSEIIGKVKLGKQSSIWPLCVLRGDVDRISVGKQSNIQDLTVIHCRKGFPTLVGDRVTVGHRVILHGSKIGHGCLIGMGAIVMEAVVGNRCIVAAGALVLAGMKIPAESLVLGSPAKVVRRLTPKELLSLEKSADNYLQYSQQYRQGSSWVPS